MPVTEPIRSSQIDSSHGGIDIDMAHQDTTTTATATSSTDNDIQPNSNDLQLQQQYLDKIHQLHQQQHQERDLSAQHQHQLQQSSQEINPSSNRNSNFYFCDDAALLNSNTKPHTTDNSTYEQHLSQEHPSHVHIAPPSSSVRSSIQSNETDSTGEDEEGNNTISDTSDDIILDDKLLDEQNTKKNTDDSNASHDYNRNPFKLQTHTLDYFDKFQTDSTHAFGNQVRNSNLEFQSQYLQPNSQFIGQQKSGDKIFEIEVEFKTINLKNSLCNGFLKIYGLTDEHSEITTYFKGEIINNPFKSPSRRFSFLTENKQWGSFPKNDFEHWRKLTKCSNLSTDKQLIEKLNKIYHGEEDSCDCIYMRWKEEFLLPDARIRQISNASFEGFYYIVLNINSGLISGLYYHHSSEKFQSLNLKYVNNHGVSNSFEYI